MKCNGLKAKLDKSSPDDYLARYPVFITIELLIRLDAEFNFLSPHKLRVDESKT